MTPSGPTESDPKPEPPDFADYDACCGSGCDPCLLDLYVQAKERYQVALRAWHERHPEATPSGE